MAREILEKTQLDSDESIASPAVKSLFTNVPLTESVEKAMRSFSGQNNPTNLSSKTIE